MIRGHKEVITYFNVMKASLLDVLVKVKLVMKEPLWIVLVRSGYNVLGMGLRAGGGIN